MGHFGVEKMERARRVTGKASVEAHCLRMCPGSKSGPVAFVTSMEARSFRVQRVRRSVKACICEVGWELGEGAGGGVAVSL